MGNVCSFDSPELVRAVATTALGGVVGAVIPTFAAAASNLGFLSVTGSFTRNGGATCSFETSTFGAPATITPVIVDPTGGSTLCDGIPVTAGAAASDDAVAITGPVVCSSVFFNSLPTGQYRLEFTGTGFAGGDQDTVVPNTFSWTTPLTASTTTTTDDDLKTSTVTTETRLTTVTATAFGPTATTTNTVTATSKTTLRPSTVTKYICPTSPAKCPKGGAPKDPSKCPAADQTCYNTPNGYTYQLECGVDRPGNDLSMKKCSTMQVCLSTCSNTYGCNAVAYYPKDRRCYLKSAAGYSTKKSGVVGARLISKSTRNQARGNSELPLGTNPDFTYPPTPEVSTVTVAGQTDTVTSMVVNTVTATSTGETVYATVVQTVTSTKKITPAATTVTKERCTTKKGYY